MDMNATTPDITLDVRTPPKVKQAMKKQQAAAEQAIESSHAGIAIPVDESDVVLEESTRKYFYKIEPKATTDRGLSTWVLLNSQTSSPAASALPVSSTSKPAKNQTIIDTTEMVHKINKPVFKKRVTSTTTRKPSTTTTESSDKDKEVKLTKIKASVFTSAVNNKTEVVQIPTIIKKTTTESTTAAKKQTTFVPVKTTSLKTPTTTELVQTQKVNSSSALLPVEAKEADTELEQEATITLQPTKKPKRSSNKRKKNKNHRRRKPSIDRSDTANATASSKIALKKQKPIGTQIYNYLSREIMPTVGVGLVGLMVTAGLASYFLYPFGIARRSYDIDRKDKEGTYYYSDDYNTGGIAEEEVIGKVIAGMPGNSVSHHRVATSRDAFPANVRYRNNDQYYKKNQQPKASVESVQLSSYDNVIDSYATQGNTNLNKMDAYAYKADIMEKNTETGYTVSDQQFVVGNIPKEFQQQQEVVTPAAVPEHGPRSLGIRRRRSSNDLDGDVTDDDDQSVKTSTSEESNLSTTTTTESSTKKPKAPSLLNSLINLFEVKVKLGLEVLENTSQAVARYFSKVNKRFSDRVNRTKS